MSPAIDAPPRTARTSRAAPAGSVAGGRGVPAVLLGMVAVGVVGVAVVFPDRYGVLIAAGAIGLVGAVLGLASPALATAYLLLATFARLALPTGSLPVDPFLLAFAGLLAAALVRAALRPGTSVPVRGLGALVAAYIGWNVLSAVGTHELPAAFPVDGTTVDVPRFILIGTVMPLVVLLVGVAMLGRPGAIRVLVATTLGIAGYSALVSVLQFHGPTALIWPSYAAGNPDWPGRATGVVNQPVVHGLILTTGYLVAVMVASQPTRTRAARVAAAVLAAACCYSVYLTFTRSAWLCLAVCVLLGAVLARGWRTGFVVTAAVALVGAGLNLRSLTGADRQSGGVGSANEIHDRLNINVTGVWATLEKPLTGWGIGRFGALNTRDHQQFSHDVPWERGYGLAAHLDLLGISSELGVVGAALWLAIVVTTGVVLVRAVRDGRRPPPGRVADPADRFLLVALLVLVSWVLTGLTVDQRFFDVTNLLTMALVGAAMGRAAHLRAVRRRAGEP